LYCAYHDHEWGVPEHDSRALWEKLVLDGFQAGLSWITILRKREAFRAAFAGFDPATVAGWGESEVARCLSDPGIVRHRGKIEAAIGNARAYLAIETREGFAAFLWSRAGGVPQVNQWSRPDEVRRWRNGSRRTCALQASASAGRRSSMPSCRRPGWSTTTCSPAPATPGTGPCKRSDPCAS
jgi:DNA-3-methyladenine glycosylase I